MPRARGTKQYQPLTLGLITEASPLDFPQGATVDERNFLFEHNGNRRVKRKGLSTRKSLSYEVRHAFETPVSVRLGAPFYWEKYELTILPLIVEQFSSSRVEFHFYDNTGTFLDSFYTSSDIAAPVKDVAFEDYTTSIMKVDDERLILGANFLSAVHYVDIDKSSGTQVVCSQSILYYRDFATLSTDNSPEVRPSITGGVPDADVNFRYNTANAGFVKKYPTRNPSADSPLQGILLAWSNDSSIKAPAMTDNVNAYIQRDENNGDLVFDVDLYKIGTPRGFNAPIGSQIVNNDGVLGGRSISDDTIGPSKLSELLRFNI
ncbi:hypothetical protein NVP1293O_12 [Vibrio phage 1.293.O._10N.261.52.E1]|nr:hypothetical protein NVP1293O_12 [Vibrio phage 1.293.O._10N.261.52.E1]